MRILRDLASRYCIPLILLIGIFIFFNLKWGKEKWKEVIVSDGKGYYAYLPATFIYHDLNFSFFDTIENKYYPEGKKYDYRSYANKKFIDKYFCGVAVLQTPFFLLGHLATKITGEAQDGYSKWYVLFFYLGAVVYLGIGLFYLKRFLRMHGANAWQAAFLTSVIFFGSNLFYYAFLEPAMSHLYSFTLVAVFLVYGKRWIDNGDKRSALIASLLLGLIFIVRPVNVMISFWLVVEAKGILPFLHRRFEMLRSPKQLMTALLLFALPIFLQVIIYKIQCGDYIVNSYRDETFHFTKPHFIEFLFSYKKGLFIYTPLTFVALFGLIPLWKKNKFRAVAIFIFLFCLIYILSCWWMWYYGGSFGTRVMVEYLPVFAFLLWQLWSSMKLKWASHVVVLSLLLITLFCQFQTLQYRYQLIHWSDMNKEKYWDVFLKLKK